MTTLGSLLVALIVASLIASTSALQTSCANDGILLEGVCKCRAYTFGDRCEAINCQAMSVPDGNRCSCGPGYYSKYCEIRGCRPGIQKDLDISRRSFIVVFNTKTSMKAVWDAFKANIGGTIDKLVSTKVGGDAASDWIANYIFYGFASKDGKSTIQTKQLDTKEDFLQFVDSVQLLDGDSVQPVLTALLSAQQTYPTMRPFGQVLVFTDSLASDATPVSYRQANSNAEMSIYQLFQIWRAKLAFVLTLGQVDSSSDGFDVYRRLAPSTHGDLFLVSAAEVQDVLTKVFSTYAAMENVALGYGVTGDVQVQPTRDSDGDDVFVLLTVDSTNTNNKLPGLTGETPIASGNAYALYSTKSVILKISAAAGSAYTYRVFLQSWSTILFTETNEGYIDVGKTLEPFTMDHMGTAQIYGFAGFTNLSYAMTTSQNAPVKGELFGWLRPQQDCSYPYSYQMWTKDVATLCPAGTSTRILRMYFGANAKIRLFPSVCIDNSSPTKIVAAARTASAQNRQDAAAAATCTSLNLDAVGDHRQHEFRQLIFVMERNDVARSAYESLAVQMSDLVNRTITDSFYNRQFSLISFDDKSVDVQLSTYDQKQFVVNFKKTVQTMTYKTNVDNTKAIEAVYKAQKISLLSPAIVYVFVSRNTKSVQNYTDRHWDTLQRDVQVNVITLSTDSVADVFAAPTQLRLLQRQSGGRIMHLTTTTDVDFVALISPTLFTTALSLDMASTMADGADFVVEKGAQTVVVEFVGMGISADNVVQIFNPNKFQIDSKKATTFINADILVVTIQGPLAGHWGVVVGVNGKWGMQVRHITSYAVVPGFVAAASDDFATTQIFSQRQAIPQATFVAVRVSHDEQQVDIPLQSATIETVDLDATSKSSASATLDFSTRDDKSCAYQYVSKSIQVPTTQLVKVTIVAMSSDDPPITLLQRVFYFYQQLPADPSICNGGRVTETGQCLCPAGYTGEFCYTPMCANGATESYGICSCPLGNIGEFCENLIVPVGNWTDQATTLSTPSQPSTFTSTVVVPTTTRDSIRVSHWISVMTTIFISIFVVS